MIIAMLIGFILDTLVFHHSNSYIPLCFYKTLEIMKNVYALSLCLSSLSVLISILPLTYGRIKAGYS